MVPRLSYTSGFISNFSSLLPCHLLLRLQSSLLFWEDGPDLYDQFVSNQCFRSHFSTPSKLHFLVPHTVLCLLNNRCDTVANIFVRPLLVVHPLYTTSINWIPAQGHVVLFHKLPRDSQPVSQPVFLCHLYED